MPAESPGAAPDVGAMITYREDGALWCAYLTEPTTHAEICRLGSMPLSERRHFGKTQAFMSLMRVMARAEAAKHSG